MLHLITEENQHEYKVRFIGALIAFPIPLNFLEMESNVVYLTMTFALGFPLWGIMFNLLAYLIGNLIQGFVPQLSREQIYRSLILGHLPLFLAVFSIPAWGLIPFQQLYLLVLWGVSIFLSFYLINKATSKIKTHL